MPTNVTPDGPIVRGHDFGRPDGRGRDLDAIMDAMMTTGFQATTLGQAVQELNRMVRVFFRGREGGGVRARVSLSLSFRRFHHALKKSHTPNKTPKNNNNNNDNKNNNNKHTTDQLAPVRRPLAPAPRPLL